MFDDLKCEYPLPDGHMQDAPFQTKDTPAQYMERYTITADGRLIHHAVEYFDNPPEQRPYYDPEIKGFKNEIDEICGIIGQRPIGDIDTRWHGDIYFYTSVGWFADGAKSYHVSRGLEGDYAYRPDNTKESARYEWFEYRARFTNGRIQSIERMPER